MDIRFSRQKTGLAESPELALLGLGDTWMCAHIQIQIEPTTRISSPLYASASFLVPAQAARDAIADIEARVASIPDHARREGGAISMLFEQSRALVEWSASQEGSPEGSFSRFDQRCIWVLPKTEPDPFGGVGLAVCYSASAPASDAPEGIRKALAMERVEALGLELAVRVGKRLGLGHTPALAVRFGPDVDARRWHEGVSDESAAQWRSQAEHVSLSLDAPAARKASRPSNL